MLNQFVRKYCFTVLGLGLSFYSVLAQTLFHESRIKPRYENLVAIEETPQENFNEELDLSEADDLEIIDDLDEDEFGTEEERTFFSAFMENARFSLKHEFGYGFQAPQKIVSNRSSLRLEWESDFSENLLFFFDGKGSIHHSNDHLTKAQNHSPEAYGTSNLRELYLQGSYGDWSFKVGRQIVIWGESENSVLNEVSPQDQSEVYFTSLEDSRIGQNLIRINYFSSQWDWDMFVNPDSQTNKLPEEHTEYYIPLPENDTDYDVHETMPFQTEVGFHVKRNVESGDFAFYAAKLNENQPFYQQKSEQIGNKTILEKTYPNYQMFGMSGNLNFGNTLLKTELAHKSKKWFAAKHSTDVVFKKNTIDMALDLEYQFNDHANIYAGVSDQHILGWEEGIQESEDSVKYFLGGNQSIYNQTLDLDYILNYDHQNASAVYRLSIKYKIMDDLNLDVSTVYFDPTGLQKGSGMYFQNKSRITANLTYYF
jgi:hypothetical protein